MMTRNEKNPYVAWMEECSNLMNADAKITYSDEFIKEIQERKRVREAMEKLLRDR